MSIEAHRGVLTQAIASDLPMRLFKQNPQLAAYVGLWSAWWINGEDEPAGLKVVLVTVPRGGPGSPTTDATTLGALQWTILQLQTVAPGTLCS